MDVPIPSLLVLFLATWAGGGLAFLFPSTDSARSKLFLSFSGAYLFGLAVMKLFPDLFADGPEGIGAWVLAGFLVQLLLDLLSGGIEHGHVQHRKVSGRAIPSTLLVGLFVHSLLESIPLGEGGALNGPHFLVGLAIHKVPVSLALAALLMNGGLGKTKALMVLAGFSLIAPIGILLGYALPTMTQMLPPSFSHYLLALVLGIILHVSTTILFESSEGHRFEGIKLLVVLAGFILAISF